MKNIYITHIIDGERKPKFDNFENLKIDSEKIRGKQGGYEYILGVWGEL